MSCMFESLEDRRLMSIASFLPVDINPGGPMIPAGDDTSSPPSDTFVPTDTFLPTDTFAPTDTSVSPIFVSTSIITPKPTVTFVMNNAIGQGVAVQAKAGNAFTKAVAQLPRKTVKNLAALSGSIDWGDGSDPTAATFRRTAGGKIQVTGTHTYSAAGKYNITISIYRHPVPVAGQPTPFFELLLGAITSKARVTA